MLIPIIQEISTHAGLQRDMCLRCPKHRWVDTLFYSLPLQYQLQRPSTWLWRRLWKRQYSFKGCSMTWWLIRICLRSTVIVWVLSIWRRIRCIMQERSTLTLGFTLFRRFLMNVTLSYKRFTQRRIPLICLPRWFQEWNLHIVKSCFISFQLLELGGARLDELRMAWSFGQCT